MRLQEAIDNVTPASKQPTPGASYEFQKALQILIEAGKEIQHLHEIQVLHDDELLPGETKG